MISTGKILESLLNESDLIQVAIKNIYKQRFDAVEEVICSEGTYNEASEKVAKLIESLPLANTIKSNIYYSICEELDAAKELSYTYGFMDAMNLLHTLMKE